MLHITSPEQGGIINPEENGTYRWVFELPMFTNPTILFSTWNVLAIAFGIVYLFMLILTLPDILSGDWDGFVGMTRMFVILLVVFLVIGVIAYLILAWIYGGKYVAVFHMGEHSITHTQIPSQQKKSRAIGALTSLAGSYSGNLSMTGLGINLAAGGGMTTEYANVRTLRACPKRNLIKINTRLLHNQVYASDEDFAFVLQYLVDHCPRAKVKGRKNVH